MPYVMYGRTAAKLAPVALGPGRTLNAFRVKVYKGILKGQGNREIPSTLGVHAPTLHAAIEPCKNSDSSPQEE